MTIRKSSSSSKHKVKDPINALLSQKCQNLLFDQTLGTWCEGKLCEPLQQLHFTMFKAKRQVYEARKMFLYVLSAQ